MDKNISSLPYMNYKQLQEFRASVYERLNFAKDATFELMDAVLTTRHADSLAEFSLSPFFRRKWPSTYEALEDCRPSRNKLMGLYINQMPTQERPVLGVDHTANPRLHSPTLQDRTYQHQPLRPIILLDSEYGNASFLNQTKEIKADFLMRIRSNRCLYSAPPLYTGKGRPRKHE